VRRESRRGRPFEDWPFGYEEIEPYYDKVEYELGVSGQAGNINGTIDPRGNPFEGPRTRATRCRRCGGQRFTRRWRLPQDPRVESVPWSRRDQLAHLSEPLGVHVSRLLRDRRLSRRRESVDGRHHHSARAGHGRSRRSPAQP